MIGNSPLGLRPFGAKSAAASPPPPPAGSLLLINRSIREKTMIVTAGSTNVSVYFYIVGDAGHATPGEPVTGLLFSDIETGGSASYMRQGAARTDLTLITLANASAAHSDGGFILVDDTNMPGVYRCDYPDAAFATGVDQTILQISVASANNAIAAPIFVEISDVNLRYSVRAGLTTLPNANADGAGGLPISDAGGLDLDAKLANTNEVTVARMGTLTDLVDGGRLDLIIDTIAQDTTTDIPALISTAQADLDIITGADGVNLLSATQASIDAIETDTSTTLDTKINDIQGATFSSSTDSLEAIRNRGDAAWTTGAGGADKLVLQDTTIATLATQTSFTLTAGSADDDAYNNCTIVVEDVSTATQKAVGMVLDYTGSTKTVTLKEALAFTIAATDKVYILAENSLKSTVANMQLDVNATGGAGIDWGNVQNPTTSLDLSGTDIQLVDTVTTYTGNTLQTGDSFARLGAPAGASIAADLVVIDNFVDGIETAVITNAAGVDISADIAAVKVDTAATLVDTAEIGVAGAGLTDLGGMSTGMKAEVNTEADTALTDYDGPTNAEMEARTPTAAQLAYIVSNASTGLPVTFTTSGGSTTAAVFALVDGGAGSATDDQYNGRLLVFTDGTLKGVVTDITDYTGSTTTATITAIPTAPTSSHNARLI